MFFGRQKNYKKNHRKRLEDQIGADVSNILNYTRIEGSINGKNSLIVSGLVEGDITSETLVWIEKGGRIQGSIKAFGVIVEGEVNGNIEAKERTELRSGARVIGDISCSKLSVAEDAFFEGNIKMYEENEQPYSFVDKRKT